MASHDQKRVVRVPTASLVRGDSPRSVPEVREHTRLLADSPGALPPVLVHRGTMRVIDGMHRIGAALLRRQSTIEVVYFDGDDADAYLASVQANTTHGLPLSRAEREAAAERLIGLFPGRSDRWIADVVSLAPATIGLIRARVAGVDGPTTRIGRDGKARPLDSAAARQAAHEVLAERPDASLREVARVVGLSPTTVRDVRERMRRGDDPVPQRAPTEPGRRRRTPTDFGHRKRLLEGRGEPRDPDTLLRILSRDPALRLSESGRSTLRWLSAYARGVQRWQEVVERLPPHCAYLVAELALSCAEQWTRLAERMGQKF